MCLCTQFDQLPGTTVKVSNKAYHTYQPSSDRAWKAYISEDDVKTELVSRYDLPVIRVFQFEKKVDGKANTCNWPCKQSVRSWDLQCHPALFSVWTVHEHKIGHTKAYCRLPPTCIICSGEHLVQHYTKDESEQPKCASCGEGHNATCRACKKYKEITKRNSQPNVTRTVVATTPTNALWSSST